MNFRKNKGYVGIDASLGVLILLIMVPTLVGMIYNVKKTNNFIDRKAEAISIAVNTIETAKGIDNLEDVTQEEIGDTLEEIYGTYFNNTDFTITKNDVTYKIEIDIKDYSEIDTTAESNIVKTVTATVIFKSGKEQKSIDLSTVLS